MKTSKVQEHISKIEDMMFVLKDKLDEIALQEGGSVSKISEFPHLKDTYIAKDMRNISKKLNSLAHKIRPIKRRAIKYTNRKGAENNY